jgi:hypothetical protein
MNDFVAKPVQPDLLAATLLKWLPTEAVSDLRSRAPRSEVRCTALAGTGGYARRSGIDAPGHPAGGWTWYAGSRR